MYSVFCRDVVRWILFTGFVYPKLFSIIWDFHINDHYIIQAPNIFSNISLVPPPVLVRFSWAKFFLFFVFFFLSFSIFFYVLPFWSMILSFSFAFFWTCFCIIGLAVRVFANRPGDLGSIPGRVIPKTQKWYLMPPCLTLSIIRYGPRVKWSNPGKGVSPSPTPRCSKLSKREPSGHPRLWSPTTFNDLFIYFCLIFINLFSVNIFLSAFFRDLQLIYSVYFPAVSFW